MLCALEAYSTKPYTNGNTTDPSNRIDWRPSTLLTNPSQPQSAYIYIFIFAMIYNMIHDRVCVIVHAAECFVLRRNVHFTGIKHSRCVCVCVDDRYNKATGWAITCWYRAVVWRSLLSPPKRIAICPFFPYQSCTAKFATRIANSVSIAMSPAVVCHWSTTIPCVYLRAIFLLFFFFLHHLFASAIHDTLHTNTCVLEPKLPVMCDHAHETWSDRVAIDLNNNKLHATQSLFFFHFRVYSNTVA